MPDNDVTDRDANNSNPTVLRELGFSLWILAAATLAAVLLGYFWLQEKEADSPEPATTNFPQHRGTNISGHETTQQDEPRP